MKKVTLIPISLFGLMLIFLAIGLTLDPKLVPSPLVGKTLPKFSSNSLVEPNVIFHSDELKGEPYLLNVWASWCSACRIEHPLLIELAKKKRIPIVGLNYKDRRSDSIKWLQTYGNPYNFSFFDPEGKIGMDLGVYGVPETFLVNESGIVVYKHIGPLNETILKTTIFEQLVDGRIR